MASDRAFPVIPGFQILDVLDDRGGQATVYLAQQDVPKRRVAIKVLRTGAADPTRFRAFMKEVDILGGMQDPHLVSVITGGLTERGTPYLVMEYMAGGSAQEFVSTRHPLDDETVVVLGSQIARALSKVHARQILHRDIKPANILLDGEGRAKLSDFGIARALDPSSSTTEDMFKTVAYCAPERVQEEPSTVAGDVYALGATLWALAAGRPPYGSDPHANAISIGLAVVRGDRPPLPASVGPGLAATIERAMSYRPEDRYPSAGAMADALDALGIGGRPSEARSALLPTLRQPGLGHQARLTSTERPRPRPSVKPQAWVGVFVVALLLVGGYLLLRDRGSEQAGGTGTSSSLPANIAATTTDPEPTDTSAPTTTTTAAPTTTTTLPPTTTTAPPPTTIAGLKVVDEQCTSYIENDDPESVRKADNIAGYSFAAGYDIADNGFLTGICFSDPAHIVFALNGEYDRVTGAVGIRDVFNSDASTGFAVSCDTKGELLRSDLRKGDRVELDLDTTGCQQLRIEKTSENWGFSVVDLMAT